MKNATEKLQQRCLGTQSGQFRKLTRILGSHLFMISLAASTLLFSGANAATVDTGTAVALDDGNYWPFGDNRNTRHQVYISAGIMGGSTGIVDSISHFATSDENEGATFNMDVYLSTTLFNDTGLTTVFDDNHGANRTLVFSGDVSLADEQIVIDVNDVFNYSGGNLLIDYVFNSFTGIGNSYDGPIFEAHGSPTDSIAGLARVLGHTSEGDSVSQWGILRTEIGVTPVPVPAAAWLLGSGLLGLAGWKRQRRLSSNV